MATEGVLQLSMTHSYPVDRKFTLAHDTAVKPRESA